MSDLIDCADFLAIEIAKLRTLFNLLSSKSEYLGIELVFNDIVNNLEQIQSYLDHLVRICAENPENCQ